MYASTILQLRPPTNRSLVLKDMARAQSIWLRFLRWRLMTLLIFVTVACLLLAGRQLVVQHYTRQHLVARELLGRGMRVQFLTPKHVQLAKLLRIPHYQDIDIVRGSLVNSDLEHLRVATHLRGLEFISPAFVDAETMKLLAQFKTLEELSIIYAQVQDDDLAPLSALTNLRRVVLSGTLVTDEGLRHLSPSDGLQHLELEWTETSWRGLSYLGPCELQTLVPSGRQEVIFGNELRYFRDLAYIDRLPTEVIRCTDEDLKQISGMVRLEQLQVYGPKITDAGVEEILRLPKLKRLLISANITGVSLRKIRQSKLETCEVHSPLFTYDDRKHIASLRGVPMEVSSSWPRGHVFDDRPRATSLREPFEPSFMEILRACDTIVDWSPLLRCKHDVDLTLVIPSDRRWPTEILEQFEGLRYLTCYAETLPAADAKRLLLLPDIDLMKVYVHYISPEALEVLREGAPKTIVDLRQTPRGGMSTLDQMAIEQEWLQVHVTHPFSESEHTVVDDLSFLHSRTFVSPTSETLRDALSNGNITELTLSQIDESLDFGLLASAPELKTVHIDDSFPSKEQWQDLWKAQQLESLHITDSLITKEELSGVEKLTKLRSLVVSTRHLSLVRKQ